jgi:hypothetical protein
MINDINVVLLICEMVPIIIGLFFIGKLIYSGVKDSKLLQKIFLIVMYSIFSLSFFVCVLSLIIGYKKIALISFIIVLTFILGLFIAGLILFFIGKNKKAVDGAIIIAKLIDYSNEAIHNDTDEKEKELYNAVFVHYGENESYYVSYDAFCLEDVKAKINLYAEIKLDGDRCSIIKMLSQRSKIKSKKNKGKENKRPAMHVILLSFYKNSLRVMAIAAINIILFFQTPFYIFFFILVISVIVIYIIVKNTFSIINREK